MPRGRKPEVFVRELTDEEGQKLVGITRRSKDQVRLRRAIVVLGSAQGQSVPEIAKLLRCTEGYVRDVIHAFNERGFEALDPKWSGGRPPVADEHTRRRIRRIALTPPPKLGMRYRTWSLAKLRDYLVNKKVVPGVSTETVRRILRDQGVFFQRTKTWKGSPDPDFAEKKDRILALYDAPPTGGRVICVDEFGPLNLQPRHGRGWGRKGKPRRIRATYTRPHGVRHLLGALDLATGKILYRIRARKRWREFLAFLKVLRGRFTERLYIVVDNFSPHRRREVREWAEANDVELVFLPTYASWLNWIECEFAALRYFALNGSDFASHAEQNAAIRDYVRWRNARAEPKRQFAVDSKIRHTNFMAKVS